MKKILLAGAALVALTVSASAADLTRRPVAPPAYIPPVFTWTGFYAGLNAGYAFNGDDGIKDANINGFSLSTGYFTAARKSDKGSFTGGGQIGYNYQMGGVVLGLEADINYANTEKTYYASNDFSSIAARSKTQWYGTVRPRLGFTPMDRVLLYVTGGLAYGQVKTSAVYVENATGFNLGGSNSDTRVGWTIGAGAEYAVTNNITVRGEYAYVDLGDKSHNGFNAVGDYVNWKDPTNFHVVRAGVNYKF